ncbi:MAG: ABC transporter ATP-binding protein [Nitrospirae bacterium]|nr:ABC transporter ATP-binding protein [Nitrospirota bacterium]MBI3351037.1 ABC transporter ATP-binding protein [Nitrospirota bacterium]
MIFVKDLSMKVSAGSRELVILDKINLHISKGEFFAVMGPSGSGKSTLLGLMAGLDTPTSGSIQLDQQSVDQLDEDELTRLRGRLIGFVFQSYQLIPNLTALENVSVPLELLGEDDIRKRALSLLNEVGLSDRLSHYPAQLSGGEQQRVAIARAFAISPPILLADEPTGNLDTDTGNKIIDLLISLHRKHQNTMVWVTHDLDIAKKADRVIRLRDGKITPQ